MNRTAFKRAPRTTAKTESNRALALDERAQRAIKSAVASAGVKSEQKKRLALITKAPVAINCVANATTTPRTVPKTVAHRNSHLRAMARGMPCLLRVPGVCSHDRSTVVCCHSNFSIHGKGGRRRADDQYSVWGCAACHHWLDRGPAPKAQKFSAFMAAHLAQVLEWRAIAFDTSSAPRDRSAALWALGLLNSQPNQITALDGKALVAINSGAKR